MLLIYPRSFCFTADVKQPNYNVKGAYQRFTYSPIGKPVAFYLNCWHNRCQHSHNKDHIHNNDYWLWCCISNRNIFRNKSCLVYILGHSQMKTYIDNFADISGIDVLSEQESIPRLSVRPDLDIFSTWKSTPRRAWRWKVGINKLQHFLNASTLVAISI